MVWICLIALTHTHIDGKLRSLFPTHSFRLSLPSSTDINFADWFQKSPVEQRIGAVVQSLIGPTSSYGYTPEKWMFVDAGMNRGYQSLLPAALGYNVLAIEAMSQCIAQSSVTFRLNNLTASITMILAGLSARNGGTMGVAANAPCNAANSIVAAADHEGPDTRMKSSDTHVALRSLASLLSPMTKGVAVMKMDIEGSEMATLHSFGLAGFAAHRVKHLIVEVCSHLWRHSLGQGVRFFESIGATSESVYCLDPEPNCTFKMDVDPVFGIVHTVVDMKRSIERTNGKSCCGNLWFRGIGTIKNTTGS